MVLLDDRILEYLVEAGFSTPSEIAEDEYIHYSAQHVGDRCRKMAEHGLVENVGNGVYRITERGEQYLAEELNTAEGTSSGTPEAEQTTVEERAEDTN
jgi:predicted transcriptional regulator